jgi:hypothetical protein
MHRGAWSLSVRLFCSCAAPLRVNPVRRMSQPAAAVAEALNPKKKEKAKKPYKEPAVAFPVDAQSFPYIDAHTHFQSVFEALIKVLDFFPHTLWDATSLFTVLCSF